MLGGMAGAVTEIKSAINKRLAGTYSQTELLLENSC